MNEIQYLGEHLWVNKIGHFAIVLAFVSSIFSAIAYAVNVRLESFPNSWRRLGRIGFYIHGLSIFSIIGILFYAMYFKYYEYAYVYEHVSDDLPLRYILSAFWEGQEGSFLLWMFWHVVLGFFLIKKAGKWENPVMAVIASSQIFMSSMILGVHLHIGEWISKFGSNPTLLLRETMNAPIFNNADYLSLISGNGLNPLLQNYWMTIHPPVTFLGFASTIVPFAFAIAGLWTGKYKEWLEAAFPWALFSAGILGTGIFMGAVWAYEALSFGGYWAWDPVENAVLVPWLTLVAGLHTHLIARSTGYSIKATLFFYVISFPLIVYSTFLTRSGILGDTSAHAFTEMGLEKQLIAFVVFFVGIGLIGLLYRNKAIPTKKTEESIYSREFWMFIGALVLFFSSILIGIPTSLPVFNSIISSFDENFVGKVIQDPEPFYNRYQLWIAVFVGFLTGVAIFMRYDESKWQNRSKYFLTKMGVNLLLSFVATFLLTFWIGLYSWQFYLLAIAGFFAIFANLDYMVSVLKGNIKLSSSAISHFGFGLMIIGLLGSGLNKKTISTNPFMFKEVFSQEDLMKYVQLIKGKPMFAQGYWMTYESDTLIGRNRHFDISFRKVDENNKTLESFKLRPTSVYSNNFQTQNVFNPDTKHYLSKDIFSCIVALAPTKMDMEAAKKFEDTLVWTKYDVKLGDTVRTDFDNWFVVEQFNFSPNHTEYNPQNNDFGIEAQVSSGNYNYDKTFDLRTALGLDGALLYKYPDGTEDLGVRVRIADEFMDQIFSLEDKIDFETFIINTSSSFDYSDFKITLNGFNTKPIDRNYIAEEGDIAVGANLSVTQGTKTYEVQPLYIIRGASPMGVKAYIPELGLHIRFININPEKEEFTFQVGKDDRPDEYVVPIEIAENVPRSDYLILQAQIFPGINLLWLGVSMMMLGLFMAWIVRRKQTKQGR